GVDRRFRDWWLGLLERYRGERPAKLDGATTLVRFSRLNAPDWQAIRDGRWLPGPVRGADGTATVRELDGATAVWGFRLLKDDTGRYVVEVVHSSAVGAPSRLSPAAPAAPSAELSQALSAEQRAEQGPNLGPPDPEFPRIDLMVDGSVSGALFARRRDGWHIWKLSYPDATREL
ncbi:MAG TPA: hypothetical protein VFQ35_23515, partial [Polyangiaceae bacterium]|nr:hypothetical protein [Polyangiaceae bacterium]